MRRSSAVLTASCAGRGSADPPSPNLHDATRAMELAEATVRSLRRGRTVDLHYEPISEESNFKSVMTSTGCMILIGALFAVLFALAGPPLGYNWTIYIAYLIPPILVIFMVLQTLRFAINKPDSLEAAARPASAPIRIGLTISNDRMNASFEPPWDPELISDQMSAPSLINHRIRLRNQHADKLPAVVRSRSGEERAGPQSQSRPEPDMIDVINGQPRRKRSAPAGRRPAGECITLGRQRSRSRCCGWAC